MRDVIVVGAGPGGSSAAAFLARAGRDVLLLDKAKFPRDKPCGDGVPPICNRFLKENNLFHDIMEQEGWIILRLEMVAPNGYSVILPEVREKEDKGFNIPRKVFDAAVKDAAVACGAEILEEFRVTDLLFDDGQVYGVRGKYQDETVELQAKVVIGADGAHSIIGQKIGLSHRPENCSYSLRAYYEGVEGRSDETQWCYNINLSPPAYGWIFPEGEKRANVGIWAPYEEYGSRANRSMEQILEDFTKSNKRLRKAQRVSDILGWRLPSGLKLPRIYNEGVLLVGDAAGLVDPYTGEGIFQALTSGKLAAKVCIKALDKSDFSIACLSEYEELLRAQLNTDSKYALKMQHMVRRFPWSMNYLIKKASLDQGIALTLAKVISESSKKEMSSLTTILRLLRPW